MTAMENLSAKIDALKLEIDADLLVLQSVPTEASITALGAKIQEQTDRLTAARASLTNGG